MMVFLISERRTITALGHPSRKQQDWFDENDGEIQRLLEEKHRLHKAHQDDTSSVPKKTTYSNICKTVFFYYYYISSINVVNRFT